VDYEKSQNTAYESLCEDYTNAMFGGYAITEGVSVAITIVNMIIRTFNIFLIVRVGYYTVSKQTSVIVNCIFVATWINTACVLLFGNANF